MAGTQDNKTAPTDTITWKFWNAAVPKYSSPPRGLGHPEPRGGPTAQWAAANVPHILDDGLLEKEPQSYTAMPIFKEFEKRLQTKISEERKLRDSVRTLEKEILLNSMNLQMNSPGSNQSSGHELQLQAATALDSQSTKTPEEELMAALEKLEKINRVFRGTEDLLTLTPRSESDVSTAVYEVFVRPCLEAAKFFEWFDRPEAKIPIQQLGEDDPAWLRTTQSALDGYNFSRGGAASAPALLQLDTFTEAYATEPEKEDTSKKVPPGLDAQGAPIPHVKLPKRAAGVRVDRMVAFRTTPDTSHSDIQLLAAWQERLPDAHDEARRVTRGDDYAGKRREELVRAQEEKLVRKYLGVSDYRIPYYAWQSSISTEDLLHKTIILVELKAYEHLRLLEKFAKTGQGIAGKIEISTTHLAPGDGTGGQGRGSGPKSATRTVLKGIESILHQALRYSTTYGARYVYLCDYEHHIVLDTRKYVAQWSKDKQPKEKFRIPWYQATRDDARKLLGWLLWMEGSRAYIRFYHQYRQELLMARSWKARQGSANQ
ncbi:hypothetical protein EIP91_008248 [Steccherinum ochraceum]|uniref:Uncharacterized protein n=1 Tax=Steccherinum ochraceum TaxID=92696 RepID=A0A4V2MV94_9APHY|nr:hypothetical protein EIP91_008248 [Steccherinum ochraceum]